jgi:methylated-DNA-protein-cysteine methyltransferase-like protein
MTRRVTRPSVPPGRSPGRVPPHGDFTRRVLRVVSRIPPGRVATYGDVARMAGRSGAARAVGQIMRLAREPGLPYHRVISAQGVLGGYGGSPDLKAALLAAEGHVIRGHRLVAFARKRWQG